MKLIELFSERISEPEAEAMSTYSAAEHKVSAIDVLYKTLAGLGWKWQDGGYFSEIFINVDPNKNYVLKINRKPDIGYESYINFIRTNSNEHFPKISDMRVFTVGKENYNAYLIEKLYRIRNIDRSSWASEIRKVIDNPEKSKTALFPNGIPEIFLKFPKLFSACQLVGEYAELDRFEIDMQASNIMQRQDGTIVITDPYSFQVT